MNLVHPLIFPLSAYLKKDLLVSRSVLPICSSVETRLWPSIGMSFVHFQNIYLATKEAVHLHVSIVVENLLEQLATFALMCLYNYI